MQAIGQYRVVRELGRGAAGIVYLAEDDKLKRRVALKLLIVPHTVRGTERIKLLERFMREARAVAAVVHQGVPAIYEVGQSNGQYFIAMEYCDGATLRDTLDLGGPVAIPEAVRIIEAILGALQAAHSKGIYHRDVKPENVMLTGDRTVKLMDFGIAKGLMDPGLTKTGEVFGTPAYMSPEQIENGPLDGRSDLFSVGVIMHEVLTGKRPFAGSSTTEQLLANLGSEPDISDQIPGPLQNCIRKSLAKTPDNRYPSAKDFSQAIEEAARGPAFKMTPSLYSQAVPFAAASPVSNRTQVVLPASPQVAPMNAAASSPAHTQLVPLPADSPNRAGNRTPYAGVVLSALGFLFLGGLLAYEQSRPAIGVDEKPREVASSASQDSANTPPPDPSQQAYNPPNDGFSSSADGTTSGDHWPDSPPPSSYIPDDEPQPYTAPPTSYGFAPPREKPEIVLANCERTGDDTAQEILVSWDAAGADKAELNINGQARQIATTGEQKIPLVIGENTITLEFTNEAGSASKTFTVNVEPHTSETTTG